MNHSEIKPEEMYELICGANLPQQQTYLTRDKSKLYVRHYPSDSNRIFILLHGISEDSKYLFRLAEYVSSNNLAQVYTPDLRGYGIHAERKGDVDYIGQLDDDLADLIRWIKEKNHHAKIVLGGHSIGGGTVLRFAGSQYANLVDAYLFIAPYLHPNAPTNRKNEGGNSKVSLAKLILLYLFEAVRIRSFHHWNILNVNKSIDIQHGGETLNLSFRLLMSRIPQNYQQNIKTISKPSFVVVGDKDELFYSEKFDSLFSPNQNIVTKVLPNHNHDGILFSSETYKEVETWLAER